MKTNGTLLNLIKSIVASIFLLISFVAKAQPDYQFSNPVLLSGTDGQVGATYRFPRVKANTDALVTINQLTGGIIISNIDRTIDGFQEAFQPQYDIPALSSGYADFTITFVRENTNTAVTQTQVDASGLDIDGSISRNGLKLFEFNRIDMGGGLVDFDMIGGELTISTIGTSYSATNYTGVLFGASVDTAALQVMFTVMKGNISSFNYRIGANNLNTASATRYASLYFMRFNYNNSFLAAPALKEFKGVKRSNSVDLSWSLLAENDIQSVVIEKALTPSTFQSVGQVNKEEIHFTDNNFSTTSYYRLKMISHNGAVQYSNVLVIRGGAAVSNNNFKVFPSVISSTATVSVNAVKGQQATLQLVDLNGRTISQQNLTLQAGSNNLSINKPANITSGMYVAVIKVDETIQSQKIMIH